MTFAEKIKKARSALKLSYAELAGKAGISIKSLKAYEELGTVPRKANIIKLARALNISVSYLIDDEEEDSVKNIDEDVFLAKAQEQFGAKGVNEAHELLGRANSLFAGGELDEDAKDVFFRALMDVYLDSKQSAKDKYTPKKFKKQDKNGQDQS